MYQAIRRVVHSRMPDLPGGDEDNHRGGTEKEFDLRAAADRFQGASDNGDVPEGKVKGRKQRKGPGNQFNCVAVIKANALASG